MKLRYPLYLLTLLSLFVPSRADAAPKHGEYKRVHQNALALITSGKPQQAVASLQKYIEKFGDDAETQFMLTVAYAQADDLKAAKTAMEKALEHGLPPGRFLAGPREVLAPLAELPEMKRLRRKHPVLHYMVGNVTDQEATIWVRTAEAVEVTVYLQMLPDRPPRGKPVLFNPRQHQAKANPKSDFTAAVRCIELGSGARYRYFIDTRGEHGPEKVLGSTPYSGIFATAPKPGVKSKFTLAFGGGAGFIPHNERVWTTIANARPDLLLLLGDNMYSDAPRNTAMQQYCYYRRQSRPEFQSLVSSTPVYSIWDDHDFGVNDCWGGPEIDKPAWKPTVWKTFTQNWANPGYGGGEDQPGCWYTFSRGDVDFFMLDGRYYRTDPKAEDPSMLGPVQKKWLLDQLAASKATFKVLCSPVPWDFRTKGDSRDTWNGYRAEREEIFAFLDNNKIEGVLLMSADRHRSDAWKIERAAGYALYEFNSSRLTNQHVHPTMPATIFSYNKKQSFGLVHFDTSDEDPRATYEVVTIDGEKAHSLTLRRSHLGYPD